MRTAFRSEGIGQRACGARRCANRIRRHACRRYAAGRNEKQLSFLYIQNGRKHSRSVGGYYHGRIFRNRIQGRSVARAAGRNRSFAALRRGGSNLQRRYGRAFQRNQRNQTRRVASVFLLRAVGVQRKTRRKKSSGAVSYLVACGVRHCRKGKLYSRGRRADRISARNAKAFA